MSEPSAAYLSIANRYHHVQARSVEEIDAAYHGIFTSPAGQMVMDDLYAQAIFTLRPPEEQHLDPGIKALWVYMLRRMRAHEERGRAYERSDNGR